MMQLISAGFSPRVQEPRPPYVRFEKRAVERRDVVGHVTWDDVDFILITPQGSKDTVEKRVDEYFTQIKRSTGSGEFPVSWYEAYTQTYAAWKKDQDPPVFGTSVRNWPVASPAEIKILTSVGILAVEDLAQANEELLANIGMGARRLKQLALDYLEAKTDTAPLVQRMDALAQTNARLEQVVQDQSTELALLRLRVDRGDHAVESLSRAGIELSPLEDRLANAQSVAEASGPSDKDLVDEAIDAAL